MVIIFILLSALVSGFLVYQFLKPKLRITAQRNNEIIQDNKNLEIENNRLTISNHELHEEYNSIVNRRAEAMERLQDLEHSAQIAEQQAKEAAELLYTSKMEIAKENFARDLEKQALEHQRNVEAFKYEYEATVTEIMEQYKQLNSNVETLRAINDAAVAAAKRAEEMKNEKDFYRIQLSQEDVHEVEVLRSIEHLLRDKEPLNKIIWKCYYEKPTTDLIGRVIGAGMHTGIYKITEIESGKCYVGQAANLADRWKQHIKRGVGADTPTRNKLYPAMNAAGPENFTFEVIEECSRSLLDEREDYWQDYFKAKEFGYSIK